MAGESGALADHMRNCEEYSLSGRRNPLTFLSKNFINRVLCTTRNFLVQTIVSEIKRGYGFYGVLMDASQDVSCKEQISLVARYVDETNSIVERTICFFNAKQDTSGKGLYESMRNALNSVKLSLSEIVGCSFDGALNMRSDSVGVKAFIQQNNPHCIYTWCISHRYNLVMKTATNSSTVIKHILCNAEECAKLFRSSYKKMNVWINVAESTPNFHSKTRLKLIGTTRWSSKQSAVANIVSSDINLIVLIKSLIRICALQNLEGSALMIATNALNFWLQYKNVTSAFILHRIFSTLEKTTKYLQSNGLNILDGIKTLKTTIEDLDAATVYLDSYIEEAQEFMIRINSLLTKDLEIKDLDVECNIIFPTDDEAEKINEEIKNDFREFIELLRDEIERTILKDFNDSDSIFHEMRFLDPRYANENKSSITLKKLCSINQNMNEEKVVEEMIKFHSDFTNCIPAESLYKNDDYIAPIDALLEDEEEIFMLIENEDDLMETNMAHGEENVRFIPLHKNCYCFRCILYFFLKDDRMDIYKNIYKLYKYVATLPSTQVKCERDFSKMKIIKTRLRSCLGDESMENLMIIYTESGVFKQIDLEDLLDFIIRTSDKISLYMAK